MVLSLSRGWKAATIDIKTAFLLVPLPPEHGNIYIRLPAHLPKCITDLGYFPNAVHKLNKSLYGLKESPRLFNEFLAERLRELGWQRVIGGVFVRPDNTGFLCAYVDDVLCMSPDPISDLQELSRVLKCSDLLPVDANAQRHVGLEITATDEAFYFDVNNYIEGIPDYESAIDQLGHEYALKPLSPLTNLPLFESDADVPEKPLPYKFINLYQQVMGTLCWVSLCHPAVASRHGELAAATHQPTPKAFRVAKGVLKELRTKGLEPLEMTGVQELEFRLWTDCAVHHHSGRRGWLLQMADKSWPLIDRRNIVAWRSVKDRMKHPSSTSGEVNAIYQSLLDVEDVLYFCSLLHDDASVRVLSDSMSGIQQIQNGGHTIKDRERSQFIKQLLWTTPFPNQGLNHVSGLIQMADPLTKVKELNWYGKGKTVLP